MAATAIPGMGINTTGAFIISLPARRSIQARMPRETDNQHITEEKNPHIKFKKNGGFTLSTPRQEESDAEPLQQFFPGRRFVPLVEVLSTVNRFTHYVDELQHPQQRYHHGKPSEATIYAGIIGIGCAIGLRRMMRISHGINEEGIGARGEPSKRIWLPAGVAN
jgi:hypothetical protein